MERQKSPAPQDATTVRNRRTRNIGGRPQGASEISISFQPDPQAPPPNPEQLLEMIQELNRLSPSRRR